MEGNSERLLVSAKGSQKLFSPCLPVLTTSLFSAMEAVHKPYFQITSGFFAFLFSFWNVNHSSVSQSMLICTVAYPSPSRWVAGWAPGCPVLRCSCSICEGVSFLAPIARAPWFCSILCLILFLHLITAKGWEKQYLTFSCICNVDLTGLWERPLTGWHDKTVPGLVFFNFVLSEAFLVMPHPVVCNNTLSDSCWRMFGHPLFWDR